MAEKTVNKIEIVMHSLVFEKKAIINHNIMYMMKVTSGKLLEYSDYNNYDVTN